MDEGEIKQKSEQVKKLKSNFLEDLEDIKKNYYKKIEEMLNDYENKKKKEVREEIKNNN